MSNSISKIQTQIKIDYVYVLLHEIISEENKKRMGERITERMGEKKRRFLQQVDYK